METLLNVLPNLSVGVVSVLGMGFIALKGSQTQKELQDTFVAMLSERSDKHEAAMQERENALRSVEKDMRDTIIPVLAQANTTIAESVKVMERVIRALEN